MVVRESQSVKDFWEKLKAEAREILVREPMLSAFLDEAILQRTTFAEGLAALISARLETAVLSRATLFQVCLDAYRKEPDILNAAVADMQAVISRDPASARLTIPFLYLKGCHALQAYRVAHFLWQEGRTDLARYLQSVISNVFAVDIHPAARLGRGLMFDHATGLVIGETAVVGDDVSILQEVTLGGTGKEEGDRHPKVEAGVMIGAGAKILGNIRIGAGAKIGAGSVVLHPVAPHTTVAGIPARPVGHPREEMPSLDMDQSLEDAATVCTQACGVICSRQV